MSVYVNGIIRFVDDTGLRDIMRKTTLHFEGSNPQSPTVYDNLDPGFIKRASAMIAGFEIEITKMEAVFKLSQDRDQESYRNIIEKLKSQEDDGPSSAAEMEMREKALYRKK
jgi:transcriptional regulator